MDIAGNLCCPEYALSSYLRQGDNSLFLYRFPGEIFSNTKKLDHLSNENVDQKEKSIKKIILNKEHLERMKILLNREEINLFSLKPTLDSVATDARKQLSPIENFANT